MASSNRHWPSMFKSKPTSHQQWQQQSHDLNSTTPPSCGRTPYSPVEERTPEPKPRWNPRPEQIRILESIFNSGMVNPPRDEIRRIRAQLQEYGQVGDANVFYWFQNRKSRSKHKQRQQLKSTNSSRTEKSTIPLAPTSSSSQLLPQTPPIITSSSSSSDKSSPINNNSVEKTISVCSASTVMDLLNSPTTSVNQPFFQASTEYVTTEPFFYPMPQNNMNTGIGTTSKGFTQGFCYPEADRSFLLSELMLMGGGVGGAMKKTNQEVHDHEKMKLQEHLSYGIATAPNTPSYPIVPPPSLPFTSPFFQGEPATVPTKSTVFINDVCIEVGFGPFNVREAFGDDSVLIQSTGQPVLTNEWGVTVQPLQHGAFYYLVRTFSPAPAVDRTIDLI